MVIGLGRPTTGLKLSSIQYSMLSPDDEQLAWAFVKSFTKSATIVFDRVRYTINFEA